jgi:hypothetical protein
MVIDCREESLPRVTNKAAFQRSAFPRVQSRAIGIGVPGTWKLLFQ